MRASAAAASPTTTEAACCQDCAWSDERRGARGRGAQHARRAGHQVETLKRVVYARSGPPAGQQTFPELEASPETRIDARVTRCT